MQNKNTDIEILRALAIGMTLIHHAPVLFERKLDFFTHVGRLFGFWGGVDLFFVISGYLITKSLLPYINLIDSGGNWLSELRSFWIRRFFRLIPSAWIWLLIPLLLSAMSNSSAAFPAPKTMLNDVFAAFLNVANFYWAHCVATGDVGTVCSSVMTLGPYWSLSLEEQFYLLLPFFLFLGRSWRIPLTLLLIALQVFWMRPVFSPGWFTRTDGLLWGVALALLSQHHFYLKLEPKFLGGAWYRPLVLIAGAGAIAAVTRFFGNLTFDFYGAPSHFSIGLLAFCCALLVYVASFNRDYLLQHGKIKKALMAVGARSYAIYLVHFPCFGVAREISFRLGWGSMSESIYLAAMVLVAGALVALAAEATHRYVELPLRDFGRRLAERWAEPGEVRENGLTPGSSGTVAERP